MAESLYRCQNDPAGSVNSKLNEKVVVCLRLQCKYLPYSASNYNILSAIPLTDAVF
jgi:hypothetical protein